ncbi:hypothetical protein O7627_36410 [Solwaraspora sp. WMMD1047]|uniref:hypothetical protein n=1 Tax=Solwaraspora sp. WMMD1047 TaxID=3016102 RepID=UPI0024164865|nr:hypothetical protein [Solwaraspora sp. WMMD1047]MDG4834752.1 hypothetical protein [Solwaraspora sp. WMMD1047]
MAVARATLALHVPDRETGLCVACLAAGPCEPANDAVNLLVGLGLPVCPPVTRRMSWRNWWHRVRRRFAGGPQL